MILEKDPRTEFEEIGTLSFITTFRRKGLGVGFTEEGEESSVKTTQKILECIFANPSISRTELAALIGITADGVKYHLDNLRKQGVLRRVGPDKGGHWAIVEK